jgi:hypothetical protein
LAKGICATAGAEADVPLTPYLKYSYGTCYAAPEAKGQPFVMTEKLGTQKKIKAGHQNPGLWASEHI